MRSATTQTIFSLSARSSTSLSSSVSRLINCQMSRAHLPSLADYHHDQLFPSSQSPAEMMPRILATWTKKGIKCKQHLSEPRRGAETLMVRVDLRSLGPCRVADFRSLASQERRAHSDRCQNLPDALPDDVDLMIEAKDKEQAVFHLFRIYDLKPTIHDSLRPPALEETKQTAGRKSRTPKKKPKTEGSDEEIDELEHDEEEGGERIEGEGETVVEDLKPARKKRMTKKEKEALEKEALAAAELQKEEQGEDVKMEQDTTSAPTPSNSQPKKKRMTKKEKEALAALAGAETVDTAAEDVKMEEDVKKDPDSALTPVKSRPVKKRMTKKEKEALATAAGAEVEEATVEDLKAEDLEGEVKPEVEERPAPPRRRSTRSSVGGGAAA